MSDRLCSNFQRRETKCWKSVPLWRQLASIPFGVSEILRFVSCCGESIKHQGHRRWASAELGFVLFLCFGEEGSGRERWWRPCCCPRLRSRWAMASPRFWSSWSATVWHPTARSSPSLPTMTSSRRERRWAANACVTWKPWWARMHLFFYGLLASGDYSVGSGNGSVEWWHCVVGESLLLAMRGWVELLDACVRGSNVVGCV